MAFDWGPGHVQWFSVMMMMMGDDTWVQAMNDTDLASLELWDDHGRSLYTLISISQSHVCTSSVLFRNPDMGSATWEDTCLH